MKRILLSSLAALALSVAFAQDTLNNDTVVKLVKAGLGEDVVVSMINTQVGKYSVSATDVLQLKKDGVPDKVVAAMIGRASSPGGAAAPVTATPETSKSLVSEVGVYFKKADAWVDLPPEVVNFKTGGVLKTIGTGGLVKGDVNGHVNNEHSQTSLKSPIDPLVYAPEGIAITEYQLLRLRDQKDSREFRTVTGGVLHVSGGATRDIVPFENKKLAPRTYEIVLPNLGSGEYGLLPPASSDPTASSGRIGKIYSFRIIE
jgi:hypothetical protein